MTTHRPAFTLTELLALLVLAAMCTSLAVALGDRVSCDAGKQASFDNLRDLGIAHAAYAADWDERQFTLARDDLSVPFGGAQCESYLGQIGCHPPIALGADCFGHEHVIGFGCDDQPGSCANWPLIKPINFVSSFGPTGSFQLPNVAGFNQYVNGRVFDPVFYAPKDEAATRAAADLLPQPCGFPAEATLDDLLDSSYILSPAAMYDPAVLSLNVIWYFTDPDSFDDGYRSPAVTEALYPSQKTRMIEHHWLQQPELPCNPAFAGGCEPYWFNAGQRSKPVTLFYDGTVRILSVREATRSEARTVAQSGQLLWSRDTPFGVDGYGSDLAWDWTSTSYHILTIEGIRGRDTVETGGG
jgi:hypothetical protein